MRLTRLTKCARWIAPKAGFDAAQEEMGFRGDFRAACDKADLTCVEDQMALFEDLTDGNLDNGEASAIGLGCKDGAGMQPLVTEASARLPVITFDSDVANPLESVLSVENDGGDIRFVAWDLSEEIQAGLENRSVDGTMVQNAYFYGYLTAHIAYAMSAVGEERVMEVLEGYFDPGNEDKLLDTGMTFIGQETLPTFIEYQTECLGLSSG